MTSEDCGGGQQLQIPELTHHGDTEPPSDSSRLDSGLDGLVLIALGRQWTMVSAAVHSDGPAVWSGDNTGTSKSVVATEPCRFTDARPRLHRLRGGSGRLSKLDHILREIHIAFRHGKLCVL